MRASGFLRFQDQVVSRIEFTPSNSAAGVGRRTRRRTAARSGEFLETRHLLAVTFTDEAGLGLADTNYPKAVLAGDLDGDSDLDLVVASVVDNRLSWYENVDGKGRYGAQREISRSSIGPSAIFLADLDGDLDVDLVVGSSAAYDSDVAWYANDGHGTFGDAQLISAEVTDTQGVFAADMDGDLDLDVVSASRQDNKIAWYKNLNGKGQFGNQLIVSSELGGATAVHAEDLDGDGDADLAVGLYVDNQVLWFENLDGKGGSFDDHLLSSTTTAVTALDVADLDADGKPDIVSTSRDDDTVSWFANLGAGKFSVERVLSADVPNPNHVVIGDVDGDQRPDVVLSGRGSDLVAWQKNLGDGFFDVPIVISDSTDSPSWAALGDLDGDADLDVALTSRNDNRVAIAFNQDARGHFGALSTLTDPGLPNANYVGTADVDGDGDLDVLATAYAGGATSWIENQDGQGTFGAQHTITQRTSGPETLLMVDVDGDGDLDAATASFADGKLAWYQNLDGKGNFGAQRVFSADVLGPEYLAAADMDGDLDMDFISVSVGDNKVAWYPNLDGRGLFGPQIIVSDSQQEPTFVVPADIDGDGDVDLVANGSYADASSVAWYENVDGDGTFGPQNLISLDVSIPLALSVGDLDGDGDLDVVTTSAADDRLIWYPNTNGRGLFGAGRLISDAVDGAFSTALADLDQDQDLDVVVVALLGDKLSWFENTDAKGTFGAEQTIADQFISPLAVTVADLDRDTDIDILVADGVLDQVVWFRNQTAAGRRGDLNGDGLVNVLDVDLLCQAIQSDQPDQRFDLTNDRSVNRNDMNELIVNIIGTTFGDANLDGVFNSSDFVAVFLVNEYENDVADDSTWGEGDWNCDGDFSTADLVFALQAGGFQAAAEPAARAVSTDTASTDTVARDRADWAWAVAGMGRGLTRDRFGK